MMLLALRRRGDDDKNIHPNFFIITQKEEVKSDPDDVNVVEEKEKVETEPDVANVAVEQEEESNYDVFSIEEKAAPILNVTDEVVSSKSNTCRTGDKSEEINNTTSYSKVKIQIFNRFSSKQSEKDSWKV